MTMGPPERENMIPLVPMALEDGEGRGLAGIIEAFLAVMQRRIPAPVVEQYAAQGAFDRLEQLRIRLTQEGKSALLMEDLLLLDAALMLFSIYLCLECPESELREAAIEGFWTLRGQLSALRRLKPPSMN